MKLRSRGHSDKLNLGVPAQELENLEITDGVVPETAVPKLTRLHSGWMGVPAEVLQHVHHPAKVIRVRVRETDEFEEVIRRARV